jgi:hypothetical protein
LCLLDVSDHATERGLCIMIGLDLVQDELWHIQVVNILLEQLQRTHLLEVDKWGAGELVTWFAVLWCATRISLTQSNHTTIKCATKQEEEGVVDEDQLGEPRTRCLSRRGVWLCANHATNPFFLLESSERNNQQPMRIQQPVVDTTSTSCKFGGWGRLESGGMVFDCNFICWYIWSLRGFDVQDGELYSTPDHGNKTNPSQTHTKQVTPSWLGIWGF